MEKDAAKAEAYKAYRREVYGLLVNIALDQVNKNLLYMGHVLPKDYRTVKRKLITLITEGNFSEALSVLNMSYHYRNCPARGSLDKLVREFHNTRFY